MRVVGAATFQASPAIPGAPARRLSAVTRLLLASASPARRSTLQAAGIDPLVDVSEVDEEALLAGAATGPEPPTPAQAVLLLARAKAQDVAARRTEHGLVVLGCDSMLELDGQVLGKPADAADATARWRDMRGRTAVLHTGHWLIDARASHTDGPAPAVGATASTTVQFAQVTDDEIAAYVGTGEPLRVAGAFTVDGLGGPFVERIEGDYHTVVGLSLPLLRRLLAELGIGIVDLWTRA